ncbi:MAG: HAD hydrolase-like protein, partial [Desulfobacca sp.]|uniref:HAD hydrolase-like protein n=1 Tax=Desulfobacca sp. TaxID=2067990 RepID=UPI0040495318
MNPITTIFTDIGNVLLTNGWDRRMRQAAAAKFGLDYEEMNERHHLTFDTYEQGKLNLEEYLTRVVFYEERSFTRADFRDYMLEQSQPFPKMIDLISGLKGQFKLKIATVSNEGRELTEHRIKKFKLAAFVDFFISSCFVHLRKPYRDLYRLGLGFSQVQPEQAVYLDDRAMFV